jgi:hypothetical protein
MEWRLTRWQGLNGALAPHPRDRRSPLEHDDPLRDAALRAGARVYLRTRRSSALE